jgi:hypothetical protein
MLLSMSVTTAAYAGSACEAKYASALKEAQQRLGHTQARSLAVVKPFGITRWAAVAYDGEEADYMSFPEFAGRGALTLVAPVLDAPGLVLDAIGSVPKKIRKRGAVSKGKRAVLDLDLVHHLIQEADAGTSGDYIEAMRTKYFGSFSSQDFLAAVKTGAAGPFCQKLTAKNELAVMTSKDVIAWLRSNLAITGSASNQVASDSTAAKPAPAPGADAVSGSAGGSAGSGA